jgi:ATP-dependent Clp protease, protease subunit
MYFDKDTRELFIYQDIGTGFDWQTGNEMLSAEMVGYALKQLGSGDIALRVNSYGGSVDQALAMVEMLGRHNGKVTVTVDSIAASAASLFPVVFQSSAAKHARIMIHDPWSIAIGNSAELRKTADVLDKYRDSIATIYKQGMVSKTDEEIRQLMANETWFSADEAFSVGLVAAVTEPSKKVDAQPAPAGRFHNVPSDLLTVKPAAKEEGYFPNRIAAALAIAKRKIKK